MRSGLTENVALQTDLTIEHVLPQEWSTNWPLPEGADPFQARLGRDAAKHRLGNLTLVTGKLNPKMSNAAWLEKRAALREHSVMRISTDIRNADSWDEAAIAERGERLAGIAVGLWQRPNDEAADNAPADHVPFHGSLAVRTVGGPPDPENAAGFVPPLAIADEVGIGAELRRIIDVTRELGLHPRPDRYSVMVSPPADKRAMLFTVWPQWDEGGSFRIWKSPAAFAKWLPGVTLHAAQAALGASEGPGVLLTHDTEALLEAVRRLVPAGSLNQTSDERRATFSGLGIDGMERIPDAVIHVVDLRAGATPELALRFASAALTRDGVFLRAQKSKGGEPWYFQVRHTRFSQVVAYVSPRPGNVKIEYRLPSSNDTYGRATSRDNFYGIVLNLSDESQLGVALRLLDDAIGREE